MIAAARNYVGPMGTLNEVITVEEFREAMGLPDILPETAYPTAGAGDSQAGDYSGILNKLTMTETYKEKKSWFDKWKNRRNNRKNRLTKPDKYAIINDDYKRDEKGQFAETDSGGKGKTIKYASFPRGMMSGKDVGDFLTSQGFENKGGKGSHDNYENPKTGKIVSVPKHGNKDIPVGTIGSIKRQYRDAIK